MRFGICTKLCSQFSCLKSWIPLEKLKFHFKRRERERGREIESSWLCDANHLVSQGQDWSQWRPPGHFWKGYWGITLACSSVHMA